MTKPFLKWAGGKSQLLDKILARRPVEYNRYVEPMVGAGAVLFALPDHPALINDLNAELINTYIQVRDRPEEVIQELQLLPQDSQHYYSVREIERNSEYLQWSDVRKAARTIYLNKLGFNGLYRVNSSGFFNVPFGKRINVNFEYNNIREVSTRLGSCEISCGSYLDMSGRIREDDLVYLDPPYLPLSESSNFTEYTTSGFDIEDHRQLKKFVDDLTELGAKVLVSNSHSEEIIRMYRDYNISIVFAKRSINSNGSRRGRVPEVLISNY